MSAERKLKIAMFSYGLPVPGEKRGGIERVAHDLAEGLAKRGHEVSVWTYDPKPAGAHYEVRELAAANFVRSWLGRRLTMGYLGNALALGMDLHGVDVVMAHGDSVLLPLTGKPLVRIMHGSAWEEARSATSPWRFVLQSGVYLQELLSGAVQAGCVAVSENTRQYNPFIRQVIPNGVDLEKFFPRPELKTPQPSLLFVGTLAGRKRGQLLLDWFQHQIRPAFPDATLDFVGPPGPSLAGVRYHTGVSAETLVELYQRAWVYASPSSYEGFGLPYLEAMACGTPVVATPNPGSREVTENGRYAGLVEDDRFAATLNTLLASAESRAEWIELGKYRAKELSLARTLDAYERLLWRLTTEN